MATIASKFSALTEQQKADTRDAIRGYKVYTAQISQIEEFGTIIVTIIENTLGYEPSWGGLSQNKFYVSNIENKNKVVCFASSTNRIVAIGVTDSGEGTNIQICLYNGDVTGVSHLEASPLFNNPLDASFSIEIRVYL